MENLASKEGCLGDHVRRTLTRGRIQVPHSVGLRADFPWSIHLKPFMDEDHTELVRESLSVMTLCDPMDCTVHGIL